MRHAPGWPVRGGRAARAATKRGHLEAGGHCQQDKARLDARTLERDLHLTDAQPGAHLARVRARARARARVRVQG